MNVSFRILIGSVLALFVGCATIHPYEGASAKAAKDFKQVSLPFRAGTSFTVSQGAFGLTSHHEPGNAFSWDFDVPYGTDVLAVEAGRVIEVWAPNQGGGCDINLSHYAHNIKVEAVDGTVAQYVHVKARVREGEKVRAGQVIAQTALNGHICTPQLHFGVYRSRYHLYEAIGRETVPLRFQGISGGLAKEGQQYRVP
jgi:murein DD-endopeptidase MepM/ murein hydrolase activator NlpD